MIDFKDLMESLTPRGNYVSIGAEDFPDIEWVEGAKNITPDKAHVTLMYSPDTNFSDSELLSLLKDVDTIKAEPIELETFDSDDDNLCCLVLLVHSEELTKIHEKLLDYGLKHTYNPFSPHITLAYDVKIEDAEKVKDTFDVNSLGNITLSKIICEELKKSWSDDIKIRLL